MVADPVKFPHGMWVSGTFAMDLDEQEQLTLPCHAGDNGQKQ